MSNSMQIHRHEHAWSQRDMSASTSRRDRADGARDVEQADHPHRRELRDDGERGGAGRRNPLVSAMMQALQGLMTDIRSAPPAGTSAAPVATAVAVEQGAAAAAASPTAATDVPVDTVGQTDKRDLKEVAAAFAHELFAALRGDDDEKGVNRHHGGQHHHFGHHHGFGHGHGRSYIEGAYSNLAQRLQELAGKLAPAQPSTPPTDGAARPTPGAEVTVATAEPAPPRDAAGAEMPVAPAEPTTVAGPAADPAAAPGMKISVAIHIHVELPFDNAAAAPAYAPADSPLLTAFGQLLERLQRPASASADAGTAPSTADNLRQFLLGIAASLQPGEAGSSGHELRPPSGSLIDITA